MPWRASRNGGKRRGLRLNEEVCIHRGQSTNHSPPKPDLGLQGLFLVYPKIDIRSCRKRLSQLVEILELFSSRPMMTSSRLGQSGNAPLQPLINPRHFSKVGVFGMETAGVVAPRHALFLQRGYTKAVHMREQVGQRGHIATLE